MSASENEDSAAAQLALLESEIRATYDLPADAPGRVERTDDLEAQARSFRRTHAAELGLIGPRPTERDGLRLKDARPRRLKLTASEAARLAECSLPTLKSADDELKPERIGNQGMRIYSAAIVREWAQRRQSR